MTQPSEWTTTVEKVTKIVTSWEMLVHEQNQPGRPPGPTDYINALASLPKEVRSEILSWFDPSQKTLNDLLTEDNIQLTKLNKDLASDIDALNAEVARCKDTILANQIPADISPYSIMLIEYYLRSDKPVKGKPVKGKPVKKTKFGASSLRANRAHNARSAKSSYFCLRARAKIMERVSRGKR